MRRLGVELRSTIASIARAVDVEGFLILTGIGILAWLLWPVEVAGVSVGALLIGASLLGAGVLLARPPRAP